jgi:hypothetical protein
MIDPSIVIKIKSTETLPTPNELTGGGLISCDVITTKRLGIYKRIRVFYLKLTIMLASMSCLF